MIGLLRSIVDTITAVLGFFVHTVTSLINLLAHIPTYVDFLVTSIGFLPAIIMPFAIASVSIYVVFLILGRNS